ncbi:MAG: hypothetical protein ACTSPY_12975 [Candidatus Helarchaeota archaeon]
MDDSGLISYKNFPNERFTLDIEGVHGIFYNILKGYAGISTIISLILYISGSLSQISGTEINTSIIIPIMLIILPFIVAGLIFVLVYLYEKDLEKSKEKLINKLNKSVFKNMTIPSYEEITL